MGKNSKTPKLQNSKVIILVLCIFLMFFVLRIYNLTLLPVFCDEAIYIRWSQVMKAEPTLRFLPLSDGKQPLFMWLMIFLLPILKDPLLSGRLLSVLSGFGSMVGIFLLSYQLFKDRKVSLFSALLYTIVPFFVFFDRMALVDSMLMMWGIWTFYLGTLLVRFLRLDLAMMTGMVLGAALITKSPAVFFAILLPSTLLVVPWFNRQKRKATLVNLLKLVGLWLVVYAFALVIYNLLRLGPNFQMIAIRNKDFVFSFQEILSHPLDPFKPQLADLIKWLPNLFTLPILLLAMIGLVWSVLERRLWREGLFLFLLTAVPLLIESTFAKGLTPRYVLFAVWPLVIFAGYSLNVMSARLKVKPSITFFFMALLLLSALWYDYRLLVSPEKAPLPRKMRTGYLEKWTAGQGIREIAAFIKEKSLEQNVLVGTEGFFGTLPDGLQIYLERVPKVTVIGVGYPISEIPESLVNSLVDNDVYLVVNQSRMLIPAKAHGLYLIKEFPKPASPEGEQEKLLFFRLNKEFWQ